MSENLAVGILLAIFAAPTLLLPLGMFMHRRELNQQQRTLRRAAESARLQILDGVATGRREGFDVRVDVKRRQGKARILEINYGEHRLGATLRFSVHRNDRRWTERWRVEERYVQVGDLAFERLAYCHADDAEAFARLMAEPDVIGLAKKLLGHHEVAFFAVDTRRVFAVLVEATPETDIAHIIDDGAALCGRLSALAPAGGGRHRRLAAASAGSGSPFGVPSAAKPRRQD